MGGISIKYNRRNSILFLLLLLGIMLSLPRLISGYWLSLLARIFMVATLAVAWNLLAGFCGYVSFGNHGFIGLGCYALALMVVRLGFPLGPATLLAGIVAFVAAAGVGYPSLKYTKGAYFSILTLCIASAFYTIVVNTPALTGGGEGLCLIPRYFLYEFYYANLIALFICTLTAYLIKNSSFGYALSSIRDAEDCAESAGVNTTKYKVLTFAISGFFCGIIGAQWTWYNTYIDPPTAFNLTLQVEAMVMALFGGLGTVIGPILGAIVFSLLSEYLWAAYPEIFLLIVAVVIIVVIRFIPGGLVEFAERVRRLIIKRT